MDHMARRSPLDDPWQHHAVTAPVLFAGAVYAAAAVLRATLVSPWYTVGVCALIAVVAVVSAVLYGAPRSVAWYVLGVAVTAGAWISFTRFTTPWSRTAALIWFAGLIVLGPFYALVRYAGHRGRLADQEAERRAQMHATQRHWPGLLATLGYKGIEYMGQTTFPAGYSVVLGLPINGSITWKRLHDDLERLEIAARLRPGSLRLERGDHAGQVVLHVTESDVLAEPQPYPVERGPKSIWTPVPLGKFETGEQVEVLWRELGALVAGVRGRGKSNFINVLLAHLTGCTDAVVWMIDSGKGRTARPWLLPWLEGRSDRPAIDWVATTPEEVDAMLAAAPAVIRHRASSSPGSKVRPAPGKPALIIICEEVAMIFGQRDTSNYKRAARGMDVVQLGRSEAVDVVLVAQRATVTMLGSGDMKSQIGLRIGFGVETIEDAQSVFPDSSMAKELFKLADNPDYVGTFLMKAPGQKRVVPAKAYRIEDETDDEIAGIAQSNAQYRAELDRGSASAAHDAVTALGLPGGYAGRWDRYPTRPQAATDQSDPMDWVRRRAQAGGNPAGLTTAERLGLPPSKLVASPYDRVNEDPDFDSIVRNMTTLDEDPPAGDHPGGDPGSTGPRGAGRAGSPSGDRAGDGRAGTRVPPILASVARVFEATGHDRMHTERLLAELPGDMTGRRLGMLLSACGVRPLEAFDQGGVRARGYAAEDVHRALGQASAGRVFPDSAFDWPTAA